MILPVSFRLAKGSLKAHRWRTFVTTFGVVIGGFIISLVLIISGGLQKNVQDQTADFDENLILVRAQTGGENNLENFSPLTIPTPAVLTERDATDISELNGVKHSAALMFLTGKVASDRTDTDNAPVVATDHDLNDILNLQMASGEWLDADSDLKQVVLGERLAISLLGDHKAGNQNVTIKGQSFTVVGIIKAIDQPISVVGADVDRAAFISLANGVKFTGGVAQIGQILVQPDSAGDNLTRKISAVLNKNRLDHDEYMVRPAAEMSDFMAGWIGTVTGAALIFAVISLIVGGVAIMNIMLVSVVERYKEIGVRKAVGATRRQILEQFLLEALMISFNGGILGLILAYAAGYLISLQFSLPLAFSWWIFVAGLGAPMLAGLIFGLMPAIRASNYDPIEALRQYD